MESYANQHDEEQRKYLEDKVAVLKETLPGVDITPSLLEGYVTEALERQARKIDAKLIIMTTHGRTGVSRAWLGSVADSLVRHSTFPLLVIRPLEDGTFPRAEFGHFLVPLDGSPVGEEILKPTLALASTMGSRITLLHVVAPQLTFGARVSPVPAGNFEERHSRAEAYLLEVREKLEAKGISTDVVIESHVAPARAILKTAEALKVDLVAIATHGYTGVKRALLGSVTDKVLRASQWPLLLVRPHDSV